MTAAIIIGAAIAWLAASYWLATKVGRWLAWAEDNRQ